MSALVINLLPVLTPLIVAALLAFRGRPRAFAISAAPWMPLLLALPLLMGSRAELTIVLLDLRLGADAVAAPLSVLCAVAWGLAGWFAANRVEKDRILFWSGWLVSLAGISLALLAQDIAGFYSGYAMLSLASWLLIIHARTDEAWRAGRIYLVLALAGEMAAFAGLIAIVAAVGNIALGELATAVQLEPAWRWLILAGFAVKMGVVPLHVWLPLAHPVAPIPASAILSGVIVKAGLLGWLRLVPPGSEGAAAIGPILLVLGIVTAFAGVLIGLTQQRVKVVLAYSTISQMGLVLMAYAALLMAPDRAAVLLPWLGVMALHHGLNKASLFLACGCAPGRSRLRGLLVALPALAISAAPLTTGMLAKTGLKTALAEAGVAHGWTLALSLTSTATALLLWHFWRLVRSDSGYKTAHPAWVAMVLAGLVVPWIWVLVHGLDPHLLSGLWPATWPLALAAAIVVASVWLKRGLAPRWRPGLPAGDLVVWLEGAARLAGKGLTRLARAGAAPLPNLYPVHVRMTRTLLWMERKITALPVAGFLILGLGGLLWLVTRVS
ncbi:MAG TPA: complex I subunit 5 family protein [Wenzhouxiangellaceae bacterium]|nr:complex I subunit 5 family protein [Wenzhouxiangellaceae bacterium]